MTEQEEKAFKRYFQQLKSLSFKRFVDEMNIMHTRAYAVAQRHYQEAMFICLTPKQRKAVEDKVIEIRELWDGMKTVTTDQTIGEVFMQNELVEENKRLKQELEELKAKLGDGAA